MKHILIPVDFSNQSWKAAVCALSLYRYAGVRFYLFFSEEYDYCADETLVITENTEAQLTSWVKMLEKQLAGGQIMIPLKWESEFIGDIRSAVFENQIDIIVMSTRYPNIFCDTVKKSHVRQVITRVKCPVLIVPHDYDCVMPEQVVLLTDYNFRHRSQPTSIIEKFLKRTGAHLNILQLSKSGNALSETQQNNKRFLQSAFDDIPHSFHFMMKKTMDEALQFFIDVQQVDLVILFAKNINLSENILFSPSHNAVANYHKKIPFLVVHE